MNTSNSLIYIQFDNLAAMGWVGYDSERLPLHMLDPDCCIHGYLRIEIGGRLVPHMGFFGPDDVCFSNWAEEFDAITRTFEK